jgi:hypothetical protein
MLWLDDTTRIWRIGLGQKVTVSNDDVNADVNDDYGDDHNPSCKPTVKRIRLEETKTYLRRRPRRGPTIEATMSWS